MLDIQTRLPNHLINRVDTLGKRIHRSRAELVAHALEFYLDELETLQAALQPVITRPSRRRRRRRRR